MRNQWKERKKERLGREGGKEGGRQWGEGRGWEEEEVAWENHDEVSRDREREGD